MIAMFMAITIVSLYTSGGSGPLVIVVPGAMELHGGSLTSTPLSQAATSSNPGPVAGRRLDPGWTFGPGCDFGQGGAFGQDGAFESSSKEQGAKGLPEWMVDTLIVYVTPQCEL